MALVIKDREIVVPGDIIATGMDFLPSDGCYRNGEQIIANRLGLLRVEGKVVKSIPLGGAYIPKRNDVIIGKVIDILMSGWRVEFNSPYTAMLNLKDASFDYINKGANLTKIFALGDYIVAKIVNVTSQNLVDLSCKSNGLRKLIGGRIIQVNPTKVPRIIGKKGSMVGMLKSALDCKINVGQNGWVWLEGKPEDEVLAEQTIKMIEEKAHLPGLTQKVAEFLQSKKPNAKIELSENKPEVSENGK